MLTLSSHFPLDFPGGDFKENGRKQLLLHFFVFRPGKLPEAFKGKVFFMAAKKTIFHQIISCKNTLHGVSKEAKRRRKIRTILKLYNIWHKKVGTKLFSSSLKKRDSSHPQKRPFFLEIWSIFWWLSNSLSNESQSVKMTSGQFGEIGVRLENDANLKCFKRQKITQLM